MICEKINCNAEKEIKQLMMSVRDLTELSEIRKSMYDDAMEEVEMLTEALKEAILMTSRVTRSATGLSNPFCSVPVEWTSRTRRWADMCGLDLSEVDPIPYGE